MAGTATPRRKSDTLPSDGANERSRAVYNARLQLLARLGLSRLETRHALAELLHALRQVAVAVGG